MDLGHPLASLVPSLDSAALEVLAGIEAGLGTSRIQQLSGRGSRRGHQLVLDRLVEHGLVLSEPANTGFTYRLNRQHLLAPTVLAAVTVRQTLVARLAEQVAELTPQPVHASIFGSLARAEGSAHSDVDLFLVMPDGYDALDGEWETQLQALGDRVRGWTGNPLEALVLDETQFNHAVAAEETVLASIARESIRLHGPGAADLLADAAQR